MPLEDAIHWNERYRTSTGTGSPQPQPLLVQHQHLLPPMGRALDVAMGRGGNAEFLLAHGLHVVGVDISDVVVREATVHLPMLMAIVADLTHISFPGNSFDVIVNFFYLDRALWPLYKRALRPGGLLICETFTVEVLETRPEMNPAFVLQPDELRLAFHDWKVLTYREGVDEAARPGPPTARLVARRPYHRT